MKIVNSPFLSERVSATCSTESASERSLLVYSPSFKYAYARTRAPGTTSGVSAIVTVPRYGTGRGMLMRPRYLPAEGKTETRGMTSQENPVSESGRTEKSKVPTSVFKSKSPFPVTRPAEARGTNAEPASDSRRKFDGVTGRGEADA